jgi:predicted NBD/HSP70 family sugar kinase
VEADPVALLSAAGLSGTEPTLAAARAVIARRDVDPGAREATNLVIQRLAGGLASMINILNPDRIVLGGMHADLLAAEEERLRAGLRKHSFLQQAAQVELRPAELSSSALAGAAELALQPLLDDPRLLV